MILEELYEVVFNGMVIFDDLFFRVVYDVYEELVMMMDFIVVG